MKLEANVGLVMSYQPATAGVVFSQAFLWLEGDAKAVLAAIRAQAFPAADPDLIQRPQGLVGAAG